MFAEQLRLGLKILVSREEEHEGSPDIYKRWALKNLSAFTAREVVLLSDAMQLCGKRTFGQDEGGDEALCV
eukprot:14344344-Heterocapsa_arctica.AAC.1